MLRRVAEPLEVIVVDGYVWLGDLARPGLGAHLFEALGGMVPVIGVAKTSFAGAVLARKVRRGAASKPLHVTAVEMEPERAAECIRTMHGPYRMPTLLKRVDQLCRQSKQ